MLWLLRDLITNYLQVTRAYRCVYDLWIENVAISKSSIGNERKVTSNDTSDITIWINNPRLLWMLRIFIPEE